MKKIYLFKNLRKVFQLSFLMLLLFSFFTGKINAQTYVNSNLSTGNTTSTGTTAPAGFTWSELQLTNTTLGTAGSLSAGYTLADDFTVPAGPSWNVSKITVFAYQTGYVGTTSPFNDLRMRIFDTDPSVGTPTPIFGDLTTNRLSNSVTASMYRTAATAGTTRQIWKLEANISIVLAPGTYWVEWQQGTSTAGANFTPVGTVVGTTTQAGNNAKQKNTVGNVWANLLDGGSNTPQDLHFLVDYSTGACAGTPTPGNTLTSLTSVCPGVAFNLTLQNSTSGSGITYQWQSSASQSGPYTDITGATSASYNTTLTATTYYQCIVTCAGNPPAISTPVEVQLTPSSGCYCAAGSTDVDPTFEKIALVQFGTINNASTSNAGYENFTNLTPVASFAAGSANNITITGNGNTYAGDVVRVWIDYNQNGNFTDAGELAYQSPQSAGPYNGVITFPVGATTGNTRMRIRMYDAIFGNGTTGPCGNNTYGQVEDYTINITPCIPGVISTQPANATSYCSGNASFTVATTGTALTYQWQERLNATSPWTIISNGGLYSGATTPTLTLTDLTSNYNGRQYQVAVGGPCTPIVLSSVATLTVGPLVASVNPTSATICNGTIQQLSLTATAPPTTVTFSSGPLTLAIPDLTENGVNHTINVNTIPAGAIITKIAVRFNLAHTYCGDVLMNLKAPNGQILNLVKYLTGTGNQAGAYPNTGFVNTVISSTGTVALSTVTAQPITGTFRADAINNPIAGVTVQNPAGFVSNAAAFIDLYSVPNGDWTLALADGGPADVGTLTSWSMDITYGAPFSGIWTPETGLFTDAAATIPYVAGSLQNTVYAQPTVSTDYSVTISTPNCTSAPTIIPIVVANSVTGQIVSSPATSNICLNNNTSFTVSGASGNPITYQWQVSTDGGTTWNNITNGGVYSGATTTTLNLTGVPANFNSNQYRAVLSVAACSSTANSTASTLTVNSLPSVTLSAAPYTKLYPGLQTTIAASSNPNATSYQWFRDGVIVPGATGSTINVDVDGLGAYSVAVTDVNGCNNTSSALTISEAANDVLFIYPSPNTGQFQVRYYNLAGNAVNPRTLSIFDSKGARVYSRTYNITQPYSRMDVDMSNYSKGIYRVELGDVNGKRIKTGSVIIL